jgi:hypothetical protein
MVGRKLVMLQNGQIAPGNFREGVAHRAPVLEEWKKTGIKKIKIAGHKSLVETIRFYLRSTNLIKNKYENVKTGIKSMRRKNHRGAEKQEISKFLKVISEYKQKIRKIKQKVREEENL